MGQAFRRASGRIRNSASDPSPSSHLKNSTGLRQPVVPGDKVEISKNLGKGDNVTADAGQRMNTENVLEERDPSYDVMLNQMVGRIKSKPGGKLEMGEASVVERYNRPMPKLRNTKPNSGRYEETPAPPGTVNVVQIRHILLLHQGKADDHDGPMSVDQIAQKFRIDVEQVHKILESLMLPPKHSSR